MVVDLLFKLLKPTKRKCETGSDDDLVLDFMHAIRRDYREQP